MTEPRVTGPRVEGPLAGTGPRVEGLRVEGLRAAYGGEPVLHGVSFDVEPGEILGLVGESGCGKSTLGYLLAGEIAPGGQVLGGRIELDGVDVLELDPRALRGWRSREVGIVHQEAAASLDPTMTVGAQVRAALINSGVPRSASGESALGLLRRVHLPDVEILARRYPHQLSGGQQQRVVIACALVGNPRLLVLDEPTTGLDASVQHEILTLIAELRTELAAAVVLISHDLGLVGQVCDRVGVLYAGRLVELGRTEVLGTPAHPYTAALLASQPRLGQSRTSGRLTAIPGQAPGPGATAGCAFAPRCPLATATCHATEPTLDPLDHRRLVRCHFPLDAPPPTPGPVRPAAPAQPRPEPVLLDVRGLTRRYGRTIAVDQVELNIRRGEVIGLVGESGSGKTTLARALVGLSAAGDGALRFQGSELHPRLGRRAPAVRRQIQMVFQSPDTSLNPRQRIRRILGRALRTLRAGQVTVEELAGRIGLGADVLDSRPDQLSGGQKQRVAIGRGLVGEPALVVCDEPVSALDVSVQAGVLELLATERDERGTAYLFISHDLAVIGYLADRIVVMYRGAILEDGPSAAVLAGPHHPYTASLIAASTGQPRPRRARNQAGKVNTSDIGCRFAPSCDYAIPGMCDTEPPPRREPSPGHHLDCFLNPGELPLWPQPIASVTPSPANQNQGAS